MASAKDVMRGEKDIFTFQTLGLRFAHILNILATPFALDHFQLVSELQKTVIWKRGLNWAMIPRKEDGGRCIVSVHAHVGFRR